MKRRISRYAIGIMAGWALTVLAPGVVAGLVVYQFNVVRVPIAPTLVSGVRAEMTVVDAEVVHITPVMRATVVVASDTSNGRVDSAAMAMPLHESQPEWTPTQTAWPTPSIAALRSQLPTGAAGISATATASAQDPTATTLPIETMTPLPLEIDTPTPTVEIEPTPTEAATPTATIAATEILAPTAVPVATWTPAPTATEVPAATLAPTETITVSPVPVIIPTETATASPLESPLATPTALPSATPMETGTPTP